MKLLEIEKLTLNCYTFCDKFRVYLNSSYVLPMAEPARSLGLLDWVPFTFDQDNTVNKVCPLNTFPFWVKLRANQNQGTPVFNSSPRLSFISKLSL